MKKLVFRKERLAIFGTGGFGREVLCLVTDIIGNSNIVKEKISFIVDDEYFSDKKIMGIDVIPKSDFDPDYFEVVIGVGDPVARSIIVKTLPEKTCFQTLIHPTATISEWIVLGEGSIITAGCVLTCNINIGKHAHFNLLSTVGHDTKISDFFTCAPSVNISGNCSFGDYIYIGTGATIREKINICDNTIIGMGSVVVKSISTPGIYIGNPAKKLSK